MGPPQISLPISFKRLRALAALALLLGGFEARAASGLYDFNDPFRQSHPFARPMAPAPWPYAVPPQYAAPPPQYAAPQYAPQYAPPQYAAPQYAPPQYAAPQYAPQYAAPQYAAPQYAAPQYAPPQYAPAAVKGFGAPPQPAPAMLPAIAPPGVTQAQAGNASQFKFNAAPGVDPNALPVKEGWHGLSEIRLGAFIHDQGPFSHRKESGADVNMAILFNSPDFFDAIWSPRPQIGGSWSADKDTSQAYFGIVWNWDFWKDYFFEFGWGGSYHSGKTKTEDRTRKELGCKLLFREDFELGYRINEQHSLMLHFDHISNAKLCHTNEGLESFGVRYGYKF